MGFKPTSPNKGLGTARAGARGFTLSEYMVGIGVGLLVTLTVVPLSIFSGRTFAALANYSELNAAGTRALDSITRDVRQAVALTEFTSTRLTLNMGSNQPVLVYAYDPAQRTLMRQQGTNSEVLLWGCDSLLFSIYQRTAISNSFDQAEATTPARAKVLKANWTCSRRVPGGSLNTESDQSARVVIRKH